MAPQSHRSVQGSATPTIPLKNVIKFGINKSDLRRVLYRPSVAAKDDREDYPIMVPGFQGSIAIKA
jgi:hypothetical protein